MVSLRDPPIQEWTLQASRRSIGSRSLVAVWLFGLPGIGGNGRLQFEETCPVGAFRGSLQPELDQRLRFIPETIGGIKYGGKIDEPEVVGEVTDALGENR